MPTVYQKSASVLFVLSVVGLTCWSWVLIDPNFTLIKHAEWTGFRELAISVGYFNRQLSAQIYISIIIIMTLSSTVLMIKPPKKLLYMSLVVGVVAGMLSYPALSHDLFNYIFDARIWTYYGQNPYMFRAQDFPADQMVRFMHWTHRTYPYGPSYLLLTLVPSYLGIGKFAATFFLFKAMHVTLYLVSVYSLVRMSPRAAAIFAFSPLIIVEGLINTHNDFVALALGIIGIGYVWRKNNLPATILLIMSGLVKYITLPIVALIFAKSNKHFQIAHRKVQLSQMSVIAVAFGVVGLLYYLVSNGEVHPWYFLNLFIFVVYAPKLFLYLIPFVTGLLFSYYPYVFGGEWGQGGDVMMKREIVYMGIFANVIILFIWNLFSHKNIFKKFH